MYIYTYIYICISPGRCYSSILMMYSNSPNKTQKTGMV